MKSVALFAYDFPHRKTSDFIFELLAARVENLVVLAAPKRILKNVDEREYFGKSLRIAPPINTIQLCENLGLHYYQIDHNDEEKIKNIVRKFDVKLGVVAGARIIGKRVIDLFSTGVVNFHPGKIPETSGLDSLFYTIKNNAPAGVTTHFIDHRVDAGRLIYFDEIKIDEQVPLDVLSENIYQTQKLALRRFLTESTTACVNSEQINRPSKNSPMDPLEKFQCTLKFPEWRNNRVFEQHVSSLFEACSSGNLVQVKNILDKFPRLISQRTKEGWTPIILAAYNQKIMIVKMLLERGADPNECGRNGTTVLMYAKTPLLNDPKASYDLLDVLLEKGAEVKRRDCYGKDIVQYIHEIGDARMADYIVARST